MATVGKTNLKKKNKFVSSKNYNFRCSEAQIKLFKRIFDLYDDDHDGKIDSKFLGLALRAAGAIITNKKIDKILSEHDPQNLNLPIHLSDYFIFMARILRDQENINSILDHALSYIFTDTVVLKQKSKMINRVYEQKDIERQSKKEQEEKGLNSNKGSPIEKGRSTSVDNANTETTADYDPNEMRATIPLGILRSHLLTKIEGEDAKLLPVNDKLKLSYSEALEHFIADEKIQKCELASRRAQSVYVDTVIQALLADKLNETLATRRPSAQERKSSRSGKKDHSELDEDHEDYEEVDREDFDGDREEEDEERDGDD